MRLVLVCAAALLLASPAIASDCSVAHYNFMYGSDTDARMVVKSGTECTSRINAGAGITSSVITQAPANGTASVRDTHAWSYRSRKGFVGKDAFVVMITGQSTSNKFGRALSGDTKINVAVDVTP